MYLLSIKLTEERKDNEFERESNEARDYNENVKRFLNTCIRYNMNANKEKSVSIFLLSIFVDNPISLSCIPNVYEITLRAILFSLLISNTVNVLENSEQHIVYLTFCVSKHSFFIKKLTGTSHLPSDQLKKLKDLRKATAVHSVAKMKQVWQPFL